MTVAVTVGVTASTAVAADAATPPPKPSQDARVPTGHATRTVSTAASAPTSGKLSISGQYQSTNYYCVPASSSISLATLGVQVSQQSLAKQMKTTPSDGTSGKNSLPVLNKYAHPKGYTYRYVDVSSTTKLLNAVSYDVGTLERAPKLGVWMEQLPWNKGMKGDKVGHAIVVYGYDTSAKTVTVWDPWKKTGGTHKIAASKLAAASQKNGLAQLTGHRDVGLTNVGDMTGDDKADLAGVDRASGKLYLYPGPKYDRADGKVLDARDWNGVRQMAGVGDVTGDGKPDVVGVYGNNGQLHLYPGTDGGLGADKVIDTRDWNSVSELTATGNPGSDAARGLVAVSNGNGHLLSFPWSSGKPGASKTIDTRDWSGMRDLTSLGDMNSDKKTGDLIAVRASTGDLYRYARTSSGYATAEKLGSGWSQDRSLTSIGDANGDGYPDFVMVANGNGGMYFYKGLSSGKASSTGTTSTGWNG